LEDRVVIIDIYGFGLAVNILPSSALVKKIGQECSLFCHLAVRENSLELYGFDTAEELKFFEILISISGIGPKGAMNILTQANPETIRQAVIQNNSDYLVKIAGLGKKTANKLIMELKDTITDDERGCLLEDEETISALKSLGFTLKESCSALEKIKDKNISVEEKIKIALRDLGNR
ncbi:MAG TPA: Holliday junction branch migration protein RuvA, partial [Candidatus Vogelbacteria bacterium]|nr:Holliday junction branch migration protein RuvA [Candidatus Vogelbacteria bacterium]